MELTNFIQNWYPSQVSLRGGEPLCRWMNFENIDFKESFFDETVNKAKSTALNSSSYQPASSLEMLREWSPVLKGIDPTGFIFHISRCGSTLLSQLLSLDDSIISLSEVPVFDDILRLRYKYSVNREQISGSLKAAISIYGQQRKNREKHMVIKADSWHIHFWKELRDLYPGVPFILLYRDPLQVVKSHRKLPGMHAVNGVLEAEIFGFEQQEVEHPHNTPYLAKVLESYFSAYLEISHTDDHSYLINYSEGTKTLIDKTINFLNLETEDMIRQQMHERSQFHSKHPASVFSEENPAEPIPDYLTAAYKLYEDIEIRRLQQQFKGI